MSTRDCINFIKTPCGVDLVATWNLWLLWTRFHITPERTRTRRLHWSEEESPMRHKGVSFRSNDRVRQRNLLPVSSLCCCSLSGRYVNFITPKEAEREDGWQQSRNSAAPSYSFHVLLGGPYRSLVARINLYRAPEQRPSNSAGTVKVGLQKEDWGFRRTNSLVSSAEHASFH